MCCLFCCKLPYHRGATPSKMSAQRAVSRHIVSSYPTRKKEKRKLVQILQTFLDIFRSRGYMRPEGSRSRVADHLICSLCEAPEVSTVCTSVPQRYMRWFVHDARALPPPPASPLRSLSLLVFCGRERIFLVKMVSSISGPVKL